MVSFSTLRGVTGILENRARALLLVHQSASQSRPREFLMEAQRELTTIRGELGGGAVIENELTVTALHLGKALMAWPRDSIRDDADLDFMEQSLTLWGQVSIHLQRLQRHSSLDHCILRDLQALTSVLTGIRVTRPETPLDTVEPLRKRRRDTAPDGFDNPHGYYQLIRNWYREEGLARRPYKETDDERTCKCKGKGGETRCDEGQNCAQREHWVECNQHVTCANQRLTRGHTASTSVRHTVDRGEGLFSRQAIERDGLVGEYLGEVVRKTEWERRARTFGKDTGFGLTPTCISTLDSTETTCASPTIDAQGTTAQHSDGE